jgi:heme exporter protein D
MKHLQEFLAMGGYAFYVWSAYGLGLVILVWNVVAPRRRERQLRAALATRPTRRPQP